MARNKFLSGLVLCVALACGQADAQSTRTTATRDLMGLGMPGQLAEKVAGLATGLGVLSNDTYAVARNAADSANINVFKITSTDDLLINSDSGDYITFQIGGDANRLLTYNAASDTALTLKFGDGGTTAVQQLLISASTADADDDSTLILAGGGADGGTRGASITLPGEEVAGGSDITYNAGTGDTHIFQVAGTSEVTISDDAITYTGAAGKIIPGATSFALRDTANARNNLLVTDAGAVTMAGDSLGWSYVTGANTACTTTCTFAAVFGVDLAGGATAPVIVGPASATADACVCAGAS